MIIFNLILSIALGAAFATIISVSILPNEKWRTIPLSWVIAFVVSSLLIFIIRTKLYP